MYENTIKPQRNKPRKLYNLELSQNTIRGYVYVMPFLNSIFQILSNNLI